MFGEFHRFGTSEITRHAGKSGIESLSAFIKMQVFGKTFKVHYIDDNSRIFISNLSDFNNQYRRIVNDYDLLVQTLKENFTEKKALKCLYALEQETIKLVRLNRDIVALAKNFDEQWLQNLSRQFSLRKSGL